MGMRYGKCFKEKDMTGGNTMKKEGIIEKFAHLTASQRCTVDRICDELTKVLNA